MKCFVRIYILIISLTHSVILDFFYLMFVPIFIFAYIVWLLQAANFLHLQYGNYVVSGPWLLPMEQRPDHALLWLRLLQGRRTREYAPWLAQDCSAQHRRARTPHSHLLYWLLCSSQHPTGRDRLSAWSEPHEQGPASLGLLLVSYFIIYIFNINIISINELN